MRYLVLITAAVGLLASQAVAKYNMPPGMPDMQTKMSRKTARYQINTRDSDGDGKLTLQEFKNHKQSREDRRIERRQKIEGTYKSPEELFKLMDSNKDGLLSHEEMMTYYATGKPLEVKKEKPEAVKVVPKAETKVEEEEKADGENDEKSEDAGEKSIEAADVVKPMSAAESRLQAGEPFQPWLNDDQPAPVGWQGAETVEENKE